MSEIERLRRDEAAARRSAADWCAVADSASRAEADLRKLVAAIQLAAGTTAEGDELVLAIRRLRMREAPHCPNCACGEPILGRER